MPRRRHWQKQLKKDGRIFNTTTALIGITLAFALTVRPSKGLLLVKPLML